MKKIMSLVWAIIMIFTLTACSVRFEVRNKRSNSSLSSKNIDINKSVIEGGVGEVNVSLAEVGGNMFFEGGVGSATIKIAENAPVYFNTTSGIGNTDINARVSSEKTYEFKLSVGIGEIKVFN
ncbi:MAG: hypothetical protein E6176_14925 [Clostridium celatum]|uniref:LptM family lipoprotein n=1 Tax=uncultured Clostridium sp. TaxID=59620 RepID=UPI0025D8CC97|nr:hypothetical protein [uncultured Clostridium sp.]MDU4882082.1 hypothetical protein [Clostridium celatum]MDU5263705.1 hypothetical protein [Clostridium celatum]MDU7075322.1 hypothetical protein [Clostridium celatum]